ncbi:MAG: glycosyltransferase family 10 [Desulfuromonadaceae bacterium]
MPITTIAFHNVYEELNRENRLFELRDAAIGDDLLLPFGELRRLAESRNIVVSTGAVLSPEIIDAYVFVDMPDRTCRAFRQAVASGRPLYLLVLESRLIRPQNYDPVNLNYFRTIFTYDDSMVDGERFIKLNYAFRFPASIPQDFADKEKLCVMIAGYKSADHPQELYGERLAAIRWFERHHPEDFDLLGVGWNRGPLGKRLPRWLIRRFEWLGGLGAPVVPSYRGAVTRKRDVMGRYRFALCYENIKDVPGYITEKIFDAFFAGTVPVYRGANNVADHIPPGCFVDLRHYPDYAALYDYLKTMPDRQYQDYLNAIEAFLHSEQARPFSCAFFAETLLTEITGG